MPLADFLAGLFGRRPKPRQPAVTYLTEAEKKFLDGEEQHPNSSNVSSFWWEGADSRLVIRYKDGATWGYVVDEKTALEMFHAPSAGKFVWDRLRVRGPQTNPPQHQVPAARFF